jgi:hypothetical protein
MATLHLVRPNDHGGRYRSVEVFMDGHKVADLRPNRQVTLDLPVGRHEVLGRMDWVRSCAVMIEASENDEFTVELSLPFRAIIDTFIRPSRAIRSRLLA